MNLQPGSRLDHLRATEAEDDRTCGYIGSQHFCRRTVVAFISRYGGTDDYCVGGHRISLDDDGTFSADSTREEREKIRLFLLDGYVSYIHWHVENKARLALGALHPFAAKFKI